MALIEILKVKEKDGKVIVTMVYNGNLREVVKNYYKVTRATERRIRDFLYQTIMEGILKHKRKGLGRDERD